VFSPRPWITEEDLANEKRNLESNFGDRANR
jgi:hypothetical protein